MSRSSARRPTRRKTAQKQQQQRRLAIMYTNKTIDEDSGASAPAPVAEAA